MVETVETEHVTTETTVSTETETEVVCKLCDQEFETGVPVMIGRNFQQFRPQHSDSVSEIDGVIDSALCRTCAEHALDITATDELLLDFSNFDSERPANVVTGREHAQEVTQATIHMFFTIAFGLGAAMFGLLLYSVGTIDTFSVTYVGVIFLLLFLLYRRTMRVLSRS